MEGPFKKVVLLGVTGGAFWVGSRFTRPILLGARWLFLIGLGLGTIIWILK
ncbi:hypothetical protein STPYR_10284 [uncultured Stenotrophomonas sp.]|uniref:Transmembrane protein n=1 Tax=uncultured Stenotrophomonas sp. TaxID=165438 RepID=A0A1Y5Q789_9GAMM|nr:hypothetical protein STPYR_10284 [uncultured Stenotrophomonas sp.]